MVMFSLYMSNLRTFNLYAFLSSIWIYLSSFLSICIFCCQEQNVFRQIKKQPRPFIPLKKLYTSLVPYKGKFTKGIIFLFEQYEDFKVCWLLSFKLYWLKSNISILITLFNTDVHVDSALVLQFIQPAFAVPHDLNLFSDSGRFKHGNYAHFTCVAEDDSNNANQNNMLEWKGNSFVEGVLGNQGGNK